MRTRSVRRAIGLALAALFVAGLLAPSAGAASGTITFGIEPAAGAGDTRSALSYGLPPGSSANDRVAVVNYSSTALPVRVSSADATGTGSSFALAAADATPTGVGSWLTFDGKRSVDVTVPARTIHGDGSAAPGRSVVPVHLAVAARATPGEHSGGVVVSLDSRAAVASGAGVTLQQRVALRVYVMVTASGASSRSVTRALSRPSTESQPSSTNPALVWAGASALLILLCVVLWRVRHRHLARRKNE